MNIIIYKAFHTCYIKAIEELLYIGTANHEIHSGCNGQRVI